MLKKIFKTSFLKHKTAQFGLLCIVLLILNKVRGKNDFGAYGYGHYGYDKV